jgi:heme/copper-type cytochrome/quinol oxidase subunit 3
MWVLLFGDMAVFTVLFAVYLYRRGQQTRKASRVWRLAFHTGSTSKFGVGGTVDDQHPRVSESR